MRRGRTCDAVTSSCPESICGGRRTPLPLPTTPTSPECEESQGRDVGDRKAISVGEAARAELNGGPPCIWCPLRVGDVDDAVVTEGMNLDVGCGEAGDGRDRHLREDPLVSGPKLSPFSL